MAARRSELALLGVGVAAVSTAAPLIREAGAPALAVAAWRNLLAVPVLLVVVLVAHRRAVAALDARRRRQVALSGVFLAAHFASWIPSLELTSVASSVALVSTQPVWSAVLARLRGRAVPGREWAGVGLAVAGVVVLTGVDLSVSSRALAGDLLALLGGACAAAYVAIGAEVRRDVANPVYTLGCYAVAGTLLGILAAGGGQAMGGYEARTWVVLLLLTAGPQLLGHSVFNRVLPVLGATVVSVAILLEVLGAALLAWWRFDEVPPGAAVPAAALLLAGLVVVVRSAEPRE